MSAERTLLAGIASALTIAGSITQVTNGPRVLLAKLGWDLPAGVDDIGLAGLDMARVGTRLTEWSALAENPEAATEDQALALAQLADAVIDVLGDLSDLRLQAPQDYLDRTRIKDAFLTRLLDLYLIQSAAIASPAVFDVAVLLGWFELQRHDADPARFQVKHLRHVVNWDRVPMLFTDPTGLFRETYGWGTATFDSDALVIRVGAVLQHVAADVKHRQLPAIPLARMHGGTVPEHRPQLQLFLPLLGSGGPLTGETGISVFGLPPTTSGGVDGGLGLAPYAEGTTTVRLPLSSTLSIGISATADLGSGLALVFRPDKEPVLHTDLNKAQSGTGGAGAELKLDLTLTVPQGAAAMTLLAAGGVKVEAASVALAVSILVDDKGADATLRLQVQGGRLTLTPEDLPFLETVLPADGLVAEADVDLSWSHRNGVRLDGRAELQTSKAIGRRIGSVTLDVLGIGLATSDGGVAFTATVSATVTLGPVRLVVEQIGVRTAITSGPGSLGSADLTVRPTPPSGIGLEIDAKAVTGAGFLEFYPDRGEYMGAAQLRIKDKIQVKAIGLILTKPTVSFLLLVSAEFPPVQLGLGFALTGVGGLAGIHRGINEAQLFAGLRDNTLDDLLFPADPLHNIHGLLGKLNDVFPPAQDRYTFGLMGLITWGPQELVTIKLGLIVEFPTALRLVVVGTLQAAVTKTIQGRDISILHLHVNFAGLLDFDEQFIRFDAALYQSTLLGLGLEGEMALRLKYGANPDFVVTLGGFHPAFHPPALRLPAELRRLQITLRSGNPHIWIDAYLAVTANTFQFGAGGHLRFSKWGVRISGDLGFDALFQFSPFRFEAGIYFRLSASWKGHEFASIEIEGVFAGPSPWRIRGQFKLKICWFLKISVSFDESWGEDDPTLLGLVDVLALLVADLRAPANWERTPGRTRLLVTTRQSLHVTQNGAADLLLHPNDLLTVRQNTVPLGLPIDKFSEKRPQGASRFTVALQAADGTSDDKMLAGTPVKQHFAPGQFFHRSDEEKLHAPSYELFDAGATFDGLDSVRFEAWSGQEVTYEMDYVDEPAVEPPPEPSEPPKPLQAESQQDFDIAVRNNTLANSALARRARPRVARTADRITEPYVVAHQATLAMHDNLITDTETEARLLLRDLVRRDPRKARELTVLLRAETR